MKRFFGVLYVFAICVSFSGCGGSGDGSSVVDSAQKSAIEEYEAAIAAEEAAMDADAPTE